MKPLAGIVLSLAALALAGCEGYLEVDTIANQSAGADAAPVPGCDQIQATVPDGHHNPGMDCMPCHNGTAAPAFTTGGTLFDDLAGSAPVAGASIHIVDADGKEVVMLSAANGNFWSTEPLAFPVTTYASGCPDEISMVTDVASPGGCNSSSCHQQGFRVHLP